MEFDGRKEVQTDPASITAIKAGLQEMRYDATDKGKLRIDRTLLAFNTLEAMQRTANEKAAALQKEVDVLNARIAKNLKLYTVKAEVSARLEIYKEIEATSIEEAEEQFNAWVDNASMEEVYSEGEVMDWDVNLQLIDEA